MYLKATSATKACPCLPQAYVLAGEIINNSKKAMVINALFILIFFGKYSGLEGMKR